MPKKKTAKRFANCSLVYQVDNVKSAAGMYPDSVNPSTARETKKPILFVMNTWQMATNPKASTWPEIHLCGPI